MADANKIENEPPKVPSNTPEKNQELASDQSKENGAQSGSTKPSAPTNSPNLKDKNNGSSFVLNPKEYNKLLEAVSQSLSKLTLYSKDEEEDSKKQPKTVVAKQLFEDNVGQTDQKASTSTAPTEIPKEKVGKSNKEPEKDGNPQPGPSGISIREPNFAQIAALVVENNFPRQVLYDPNDPLEITEEEYNFLFRNKN